MKKWFFWFEKERNHIPHIIIVTEDHQHVVEEVQDGGDYQEDDPEPEENEYLLNHDIERQQADVVLHHDTASPPEGPPDTGGQSE